MASLADEIAAADSKSNARRAGEWHDPGHSLQRLVHEEVIPHMKDRDHALNKLMEMMDDTKAQLASTAERRKQDAADAEERATRWKKVDRLVQNTAQERERRSRLSPRATEYMRDKQDQLKHEREKQVLEHELKLTKDELAELREQAAQPDTGTSKKQLNMRLDHCNSRVERLEERNAKLEEELDDVLDERLSRVRRLEERNANLEDELEAEHDNANDRMGQLHDRKVAVNILEARNKVLKRQAGRYKSNLNDANSELAAYKDPYVPDEAKQFLAGY